MEALDQNLIERYWANEMSPSEKRNFEQRLALEAGLQQEFEEFKLAMEAIKLAERKELLQRFMQRDKILDKKNQGHHPGRTRTLWLLSAAAIIIAVMVAWNFLLSPRPSADQADNTIPDTLTVDQKLPLQKDTLQINNSKEEEKVDRKKEKPIKKEPELYAANFETYKDDSMDPTSRSGEDALTAFEKFQLFYWEGNNAEALDEFNKLSPAYQGNDNLRFFQANSLLALKRTAQARQVLLDIQKNNKSIYIAEVMYYLAWCDFQNGNIDATRKKLANYIATENAQQKDSARKLLAELN